MTKNFVLIIVVLAMSVVAFQAILPVFERVAGILSSLPQ